MSGPKVNCLAEHLPLVEKLHESVQKKMEQPASENEAKELNEFVLSHKEQVKNADIDLRDAKRRLSAVKVAKKPKRNKATAEHEASEGADSDEASA